MHSHTNALATLQNFFHNTNIVTIKWTWLTGKKGRKIYKHLVYCKAQTILTIIKLTDTMHAPL